AAIRVFEIPSILIAGQAGFYLGRLLLHRQEDRKSFTTAYRFACKRDENHVAFVYPPLTANKKLNHGAGRGGRTPRTRRSADFEFTSEFCTVWKIFYSTLLSNRLQARRFAPA